MKQLKLITFGLVIMISTTACGPDYMQQAPQQNADQAAQQMASDRGVSPLAAGAVGAIGGYLAGKSAGRSQAAMAPRTVIVQKNYYRRPSYQPYMNYGGSSYRSSSYRSYVRRR